MTPETPAVVPLNAKESERYNTQQGQRRVNLIWETTQAFIAVSVVACNLIVAVHAGLSGVKMEVPPMLTDALFVVVGFYFGRTNHQAVGGVGVKPSDSQEYIGR